ncbi:MAG: transcriptional repressor [Gammaproteobacteria bacterium]|nr:transcriptional repressor [Gammaproteobacteria bacterium]
MPTTSEFVDGKQAIAARLEAHGILPTAQRVDIASLLLSSMQHLSAEQVREKIRDNGYVVSKATVYNTLGLFVARGLMRQVVVESTQVFYDSNTAPHYHFFNVDDGTLGDLDPAELPLEHLPPPPAGTYAEGVDIVIRVRNRE